MNPLVTHLKSCRKKLVIIETLFQTNGITIQLNDATRHTMTMVLYDIQDTCKKIIQHIHTRK